VRVLGLVPARGGSKGIPRKNIRPLAGRPLLAYTAEAARRATRLGRAVLSTDDEEIARVGRACGLDVPFLRPAQLAGDDAPTLGVVQHALRFLEARGETWDAVCVLQPTSPLRRPEDIDCCIDLLEKSEADAVVSILPVPDRYNPHWAYFRTPEGTLRISTGERQPIPRRQELEPCFHREGSVYVVRREVVMEEGSLYGDRLFGFPVDPRRSINIDLPEDWEAAERLIEGSAP